MGPELEGTRVVPHRGEGALTKPETPPDGTRRELSFGVAFPETRVESVRSDREPYVSVAAYVRDKLQGGERGQCSCLFEVIQEVSKPKVPWATFVLGSGRKYDTLEAQGIEGTAERIRNVLANDVGNQLVKAMGEVAQTYVNELADAAAEFAMNLAKDRLDYGDDDQAGDGAVRDTEVGVGEVGVDETTAGLVLLAALLTRAHRAARGSSWEPLVRLGVDAAAKLGALGPDSMETQACFVDVAKALIDILANRKKNGPPTHVKEVLKAARRDLKQGVLNEPYVRWITEVAWLRIRDLTREGGNYLGWGDLLHELSITSSSTEVASGDAERRRDLVDKYVRSLGSPTADRLGKQLDAITAAYQPATKAAIARVLVAGGQCSPLIEGVAGVLSAQQLLRSSRNLAHAPAVTVFVTTFDLELELALWKLEQSFVLAIPVNLRVKVETGTDAETPDTAIPAWLGCAVTPGSKDLGFDGFVGGKGSWFLLSGAHDEFEVANQLRKVAPGLWKPKGAEGEDTETLDRRMLHVPVVVRLTGCPLVALPSVEIDLLHHNDGHASELDKQIYAFASLHLAGVKQMLDGDEDARVTVKLQHAPVLTENDALKHSAAELYNPDPREGGSEKQKKRVGLPPFVTGSLEKKFPRFWVMVGTQLADSSTRQRLMMQILSPGVVAELGKRARNDSWRTGVVLNSRISESDQDLLYWQGFDVVEQDAETEFAKQLGAYEKHLGRLLEQNGAAQGEGMPVRREGGEAR